MAINNVRGSVNSLVRRVNTQNIVNIIREKGPLGRPDIQQLTGLTQITTASIIHELEHKGIIYRVGTAPSNGGRPVVLFSFNPLSYHVVGVDISQHEIYTVLLDMDNSVITSHTAPLTGSEAADIILAEVARSVLLVIQRTGQYRERVLGLGLSVPGVINSDTGIVVYSSLFGWQMVNAAETLQNSLGIPVLVENNARAAAFAESCCGAGKGANNVVCIHVGIGIGSSIVIDGHIYRGVDGGAGEIGHITIDDQGPRCECGNYGCLETLASNKAFVARAIRSVKQGAPSRILEIAGSLEKVNVEIICKAALEGDMTAISAINEEARYLGMAIAMLANIFFPNMIILKGDITFAGDLLFKPLREVVAHRSLPQASRSLQILPGELEYLSAAIGAAAFVKQRVIAEDHYLHFVKQNKNDHKKGGFGI